MTTIVTRDEEQSINELYAALSAPEKAAVDLCSIWSTVKPYWSVIIGIVAKIPVIGSVLATILGAFGKAMDACCPSEMTDAHGFKVEAADQEAINKAYSAVFGAEAAEKPCCNIWKKLKPFWGTIVKVVTKINQKLGEILKRIGEALDKFCG